MPQHSADTILDRQQDFLHFGMDFLLGCIRHACGDSCIHFRIVCISRHRVDPFFNEAEISLLITPGKNVDFDPAFINTEGISLTRCKIQQLRRIAIHEGHGQRIALHPSERILLNAGQTAFQDEIFQVSGIGEGSLTDTIQAPAIQQSQCFIIQINRGLVGRRTDQRNIISPYTIRIELRGFLHLRFCAKHGADIVLYIHQLLFDHRIGFGIQILPGSTEHQVHHGVVPQIHVAGRIRYVHAAEQRIAPFLYIRRCKIVSGLPCGYDVNPLQRILPRPFIVKGKRGGCTECQKLRYIAEIRNRDILQRTAFTEQTGVYAAVIFKAPGNGNTGQAPAVHERVHIQALYIAVQHQLRDICALEGRLTDQADGCIDLALQTGIGKHIIINILQVRQFIPVDGKRALGTVKRLIEQLYRPLRQGKLPFGVPAGTQTEPVLAIARAVQHFRAADIYNIVARYAGPLIKVCPVLTIADSPGRGIHHRCRCSRADRIPAHIDGRRVGRDKVQRGTVIKRRIADRRLFFRINHDALQIGAAVKRLCADIGQRFRQKRPLQLLTACKRTVRQCGHRQRIAVCSLNRAVKRGCVRVTDHQHNLRAALVRVVGLAPAVGLQDDCADFRNACRVKLCLHVLSLCLQRAQNGIYIAVFKAVRGDGDLVSAHRQHNIFDILCVRKRLRTDGVDAARQSIIPGLCLHTGERFDLALGVVLQISTIVCFPPAVRGCNARTRAIQRSFVTAHKSVICVRLHNNNAAVHTAEVDFRQVAGSFRLQDQSGHLCCVRQRHLLYIFRNGQLGHVIRNAEVRTAVRIGKNTVRSCGIRRAVRIHNIALPDRDALYGCLCTFRLFAVVFRVDILHRIRNFDVINLMQGVFRAHIHCLHILRYLEHTAGIVLIAGKRLHVNGFLGRRKLRYADRQIRLGLVQKSRCKTVFGIAPGTGYRAGIRVIPADFNLHRIVIRQRNHIRRLDNMTARRRMIHPRNQPAVLLPAGEQRGQTFLSQQTSLIAVQVDYLALIIRIKAGVSIWIEKNIVVKLCIFIVFRQPAVEDEDAVSLQRVGNIRVVLPRASCTEAVRRTDFDLGRIARNLIQSLIIFSGCLIKEAEEGIADPDAVDTDEHAEMHIVAVCILQVAPVVKIAAVLLYIYIGFQGVINLASRDVFLTGVQRRRVCISRTILRLLNNNLRGRAVLYLSFIIRRTGLIVLTNQTGTGFSGFRILHGIRNGAALY